jgi:Ser/Thr protein kinase RdoA (MazF antagonist)
MKDFHELTNRGQALRLRRMALAALERYDLDVARVRLVSNDFNGIFRVDTSSGAKYVLRVCLPEGGHSLDEIRSEMMWLAALRQDTDLGVPQPLATRDGELVTTVEMGGVLGPRHCVVFGWLPGPDLADRLTLANLSSLGALAARLHQHALSFIPPQDFKIRTADSVFPFGEPLVLFDEAYREHFPTERRALFQEAVGRVEDVLAKLYANRQGLRVLHYDLHQWNVKLFRGKLRPFDFEDLMWGYPVQDIAITFYYLQGYEQVLAFRESFKRGYIRYCDWPEQAPGQIDTLIAGRGLELANFVLQDPNPTWQGEVPAFMERTEARLRAFLENE